jgi:hypothetical protein
MISPQMTKLIEAVRDLDLEIVEKSGKENVRVRSGVAEFPSKLVALQRALEHYDASGAETEREETKATHTFLLKATFALARKVAHLTGDKRSPASIINDAMKKFSGEAWVGEAPTSDMSRSRQKEIRGLDSALAAASNFRGKSLQRAQTDIQKRLEAMPEEDPEADATTPASRR